MVGTAEKRAKDLYKKIFDIIKKKEPIFIEELAVFCGISKPTFYEYFPVDSNEFNSIKEAMNEIKIAKKKMLQQKWLMTDNATLNIAAYKLLSTKEERGLLADRQDINVDGEVQLKTMGTITRKVTDKKGKTVETEQVLFDIGQEVKDKKEDE